MNFTLVVKMSCSGRPARRERIYHNTTERRIIKRNRTRVEYIHKLYSKSALFRQHTHYDFEFEENVILQLNLGSMNIKCDQCGVFHFKGESVQGHLNSCCHNGLVRLPIP